MPRHHKDTNNIKSDYYILKTNYQPVTPKQTIAQINDATLQVLRRLPRQLGAEIVRYSMQRFREQGWDGTPWRRRGNKAKRNNGRAILVDRGRLRRSVRIIATTPVSVTVGSDVPYAKAHNEGFSGTVTVRSHNRRLKYKSQYTDLTQKDAKGNYKRRTKTQSYSTKVEGFTRRMRLPRRQFLGDSPYLRRSLLRITQAELTKALKPFMIIKP